MPRAARAVLAFSCLVVLSMALVMASAVALLATVSTVAATTAAAQEPEPGYLWAFADRFPFSDERAETAIVILMDEASVEATRELTPEQLTYANDSVATLAEQAPEDAQSLLAAAGLGPPAGGELYLEQARTCRVWAPDAQSLAIGKSLSIELARVLRELGVGADDCSPAPIPEVADLLVWPQGNADPLPGLRGGPAEVSEDGFLRPRQASTPGGGTPDAPGPAVSGHGFLARQGDDGRRPLAPWVGVLTAVAIMTLGGLLVSRRR